MGLITMLVFHVSVYDENFSKVEGLDSADVADASKRVGVLTMYKILLIHVCCVFVGLDNKLYKMHGTYIKIVQMC